VEPARTCARSRRLAGHSRPPVALRQRPALDGDRSHWKTTAPLLGGFQDIAAVVAILEPFRLTFSASTAHRPEQMKGGCALLSCAQVRLLVELAFPNGRLPENVGGVPTTGDALEMKDAADALRSGDLGVVIGGCGGTHQPYRRLAGIARYRSSQNHGGEAAGTGNSAAGLPERTCSVPIYASRLINRNNSFLIIGASDSRKRVQKVRELSFNQARLGWPWFAWLAAR